MCSSRRSVPMKNSIALIAFQLLAPFVISLVSITAVDAFPGIQRGIDGVSSGTDGSTLSQLPLPAGSQLTLKDAISIALQYHPRAAKAAAESGAAQEQVGEARSYLGPQLSGVSEYLRSTNNGIGNTT